MSTRGPVISYGEAGWDLFTPVGIPFSDSAALEMRPGGAAVNTAMTLAKLGVHVELAATVGDDALGRGLVARLTRIGIGTESVTFAPARTPIVAIERRSNGSRNVVAHRPPEEPAVRAPDYGKLLHIASLAPTHLREAAHAAREAKARGALLTVDANARPRPWREVTAAGRRVARRILELADAVKCSDEDLEVLGLDRARLRTPILVITRGADAAIVTGAFGTFESAPASRLAADVTGAGDAFAAGVIRAVLRNTRGESGWRRAIDEAHRLAADRMTGGGLTTSS